MPDPSDTSRGAWDSKRGTILRLPRRRLDDDELRERLTLRRDDRLWLCYAPMDWIRRSAPIAVVGLTPGMNTMRAAVDTASDGLRASLSDATVLRRAKEAAPFSHPPTRSRLTGWLDELRVHRYLGLKSCADLYDPAGLRLVHWTSLIRYPAFRWDAKKQQWRNYSGAPKPLIHFDDVIRRGFVPELRGLRARAVFLCGSAVRDTCERLILEGVVDGTRLVRLPHPSPESRNSAERWERERKHLRSEVRRLLGELA
jgi:hypothetical protein